MSIQDDLEKAAKIGALITPEAIALVRATVGVINGGADTVRQILDAEYGAGELAADVAERRKFGP